MIVWYSIERVIESKISYHRTITVTVTVTVTVTGFYVKNIVNNYMYNSILNAFFFTNVLCFSLIGLSSATVRQIQAQIEVLTKVRN